MGEIIFAIGMIALGVLPFVIIGITGGGWAWVKVMSAIALVVIVAEILSKLKDGKTISRKFWDWSKKHRALAWLIALSYVGSALLLGGHLMWKIITNG